MQLNLMTNYDHIATQSTHFAFYSTLKNYFNSQNSLERRLTMQTTNFKLKTFLCLYFILSILEYRVDVSVSLCSEKYPVIVAKRSYTAFSLFDRFFILFLNSFTFINIILKEIRFMSSF